MFRTILPNILTPLIVIASFNVAGVILSEASLSFLGLGVPESVPTWGAMLANSRNQLLSGPGGWRSSLAWRSCSRLYRSTSWAIGCATFSIQDCAARGKACERRFP